MVKLKAENWLVFFSIKQARRPAVVRQILTKRLSSSALFWGMRYQLLDYINVYPKLDIVKFDQQIDSLCKRGYLQRNDDGTVIMTKTGSSKQSSIKKQRALLRPDLFNVYRISDLMQMIQLLVQVASEASWNNSRYYVAVDNFECQMVIKKWLKRYGMATLQKSLPHELSSFLQHEEALEAWIFCARLTGHDLVPATTEQLAIRSELTEDEVEIILLDLSSRFSLHLVQERSSLSDIVAHFQVKNSLYDKSRAALALVLDGANIPAIARQKQLKESTICEHLLNAAIIEKKFPYSFFLTNKEEKLLSDLLPEDIDQWQYGMIGQLQTKISFFKYRLFAIKRSHEIIGHE